MTIQQIILSVIFVVFLSVCGIYIARAAKRRKQHQGISPERTMELEEDQARVEDRPSTR